MCGAVADPNVEPVGLPVGFEKFHRRGFLNYQFNRAHGLGWADGNELRDAAAAFAHPRPAQSAHSGSQRHGSHVHKKPRTLINTARSATSASRVAC